MIDLSLGAFIAAVFAAILGFGGVVGAGIGTAKVVCVALLALSLVAMVRGLQQWRRERASIRATARAEPAGA